MVIDLNHHISHSSMRKHDNSISDKFLNECDRFLKIVANKPEKPTTATPLPSGNNLNEKLAQNFSYDNKSKLKNTQGLMRINHTGEICAQALYYGQAMFAKDETTQKHLIQAANEEHNHLYWCQQRMDELHTHASILNPFWYASSFALGATAALFGDKISYGFVIEIEKQVEDHLQEHIEQIPKEDSKTHAILQQMQADEIRHGQDAKKAGGVELPQAVKQVMHYMSKFMKFLVYRI